VIVIEKTTFKSQINIIVNIALTINDIIEKNTNFLLFVINFINTRRIMRSNENIIRIDIFS
jgi:hypothetical protein